MEIIVYTTPDIKMLDNHYDVDWHVTCKMCGEEAIFSTSVGAHNARNIVEAKKNAAKTNHVRAKNAGWQICDTFELCPNCAKERNS